MKTYPPSRATRKARGVVKNNGAARCIQTYLETDLFEWLHADAMKNGRSISGHIRWLIERERKTSIVPSQEAA